MHLAYAWRLTIRHGLAILALAILGFVAALGYTFMTASYSITSYLAVVPTLKSEGLRAVDPQRFFQTETEKILSNPVLGTAVNQLGDGTTVEQLRTAVQLSDGSTSDVLELAVSGPDRKQALARHAAVLAAISQQTSGKSTMTALWTSSVIAPPRAKVLAAGFFGGGAAGVMLVLLWGSARRPVYHPQFLELSRDVRTYPLLVNRHDPDEVQQFLRWLGQPASQVVAVGRTDVRRSQLAEQLAVDEAAGGPTLLVAAVGRATERDIEEGASLAPQTTPPVLIMLSNDRKGRVNP